MIGPNDIMQMIQTLSVIIAIVVAFSTLKGRSSDKTVELTTMAVDIKYIKDKMQGMDALRDEITRNKSAIDALHKRQDDHLKYDHAKPIDRRLDG